MGLEGKHYREVVFSSSLDYNWFCDITYTLLVEVQDLSLGWLTDSVPIEKITE